ncbi:MAG TPA: DUF885 domain-containing protein, partial [Thermoanaerobaculia bacterium]|nr:DUF885 domain-containing protein [Thermoanaerobaculia bacterium]
MTSISLFSPRRLFLSLGAAFLILASTAGPAAAAPAWVERSDANTQVLLEVMARLSPEGAGRLGIPGLDESILDLRPGFVERTREAWKKAGETLRPRLAAEKDPAVRQDLQLLLDAVDSNLRGLELGEKYQLPYFNLTEAVFGGLESLLDDRIEASRRPAALVRLRKYAGLEPGFAPLARLAEAEIRTRLGVQGLLGPVKEEVERDLANNQTV